MAKAPKKRPWPAAKVEMVRPADLSAYARNPRKHTPTQIRQVMASIQEFGWTIPILRDESGMVIAGHARLEAAKALALDEVPCMTAVGWTEAQKKAYVIADNKLTDNSVWDEEMLVMELGDLSDDGFDLELTGFESADLEKLIHSGSSTPGLTDPDSVPPVSDAAVTTRGDVWLLGDHRLMCGDSTSTDDVRRLMRGERAALFATDPPYAVGYTGGSHPASDANRGNPKRDKNWSRVYQEADNDDDGETLYDGFIKAAIQVAIDERAAWYCWHSSIRAPMVERVWNKYGAFAHQQIIWVKTRAVLTYSLYMWQHEPCLMGWIRGKKPPAKTRGIEFQTTVWAVPNSEIDSKDHPTSKPTKLFQIPLWVHTKPGDLCYEPFSGSGSQIIAAQTERRRCYAMEISPTFVDVDVRRWQNFTGEAATLEGDGRTFEEIEKQRTGGSSEEAAGLAPLPVA